MPRIDSLKFARTFADAGMDPRQGEALVLGPRGADTSDFATRGDVAEVSGEIAEVRGEIAGLRTDLNTEIADLRAERGLRGEIGLVRSELKTDLTTLRWEMLRFMYLRTTGIVRLTTAHRGAHQAASVSPAYDR